MSFGIICHTAKDNLDSHLFFTTFWEEEAKARRDHNRYLIAKLQPPPGSGFPKQRSVQKDLVARMQLLLVMFRGWFLRWEDIKVPKSPLHALSKWSWWTRQQHGNPGTICSGQKVNKPKGSEAKKENFGTERLGNLPKVTQLVRSRARSWNQVFRLRV